MFALRLARAVRHEGGRAGAAAGDRARQAVAGAPRRCCSAPALALAPRQPTRGRAANALIAIGAAGFAYCFAQGFAIGPTGWSFASAGRDVACAAARPVRHGPRRRARRHVVRRCCSRWDSPAAAISRATRFVAASVVGVAALVAVFTFFPVARILISGAAGRRRRVLARRASRTACSPEKIWGLGVHRRQHALRRRVEHAGARAAVRRRLHGARPRLRADRHPHRLRQQDGCCASSPMLPIITPPFVIGLGLILIFGRSGLVNQLLEYAFGWQLGRWIYGLQGVLVAQVFAFTPIAFLVLIGVVEGVSPSLEEAAQTLRADRWRVFADVSLPLMRPGLANAFLISFIESIADFGNPILLGGNFGVLSTEIFFSVVGAQLDQGRAATLGILLLDASRSARSSCSAGCSAARCTRRSPARATPDCRRSCPTAFAASATAIALPWAAAHGRHLRDGAGRRLRRDLGPRLHADAAALREGVRHRMDRHTASCGPAPRGTRSGPRSSSRRSPRRSPPPSAS